MKTGYAQAMYGLKRLYGELARDRDEQSYRSATNRVTVKILHVVAVMRIIDPNFDVAAIILKKRYKPNSPYKRGTLVRAMMDVLRAAERPLKSSEIAAVLLRRAGVQVATKKMRFDIYCSVHRSLGNYERYGKVERIAGRPARWRLISTTF